MGGIGGQKCTTAVGGRAPFGGACLKKYFKKRSLTCCITVFHYLCTRNLKVVGRTPKLRFAWSRRFRQCEQRWQCWLLCAEC
nr:MAG TPA: hypothetical protein [Caudoviricetes sp.]